MYSALDKQEIDHRIVIQTSQVIFNKKLTGLFQACLLKKNK